MTILRTYKQGTAAQLQARELLADAARATVGRGLESSALRALVADGAATVPGAKLWPNGLGFDVRQWSYRYESAAGQWIAVWGTGSLSGSGSTPEAARVAARVSARCGR